MKLIFCLTACAFVPLIGFAEPARPAPKEFDNLQLITGFHSHFNKPTGFEYRVLEMDGSATVAMNPINLYLVVTNNSSGTDLQSMMVVLPKVSAIKGIRFSDHPNEIQINALLDKLSENESKQQTIAVTIKISAPIKNGKLPQEIDVFVEEKDKAEQKEG